MPANFIHFATQSREMTTVWNRGNTENYRTKENRLRIQSRCCCCCCWTLASTSPSPYLFMRNACIMKAFNSLLLETKQFFYYRFNYSPFEMILFLSASLTQTLQRDRSWDFHLRLYRFSCWFFFIFYSFRYRATNSLESPFSNQIAFVSLWKWCGVCPAKCVFSSLFLIIVCLISQRYNGNRKKETHKYTDFRFKAISIRLLCRQQKSKWTGRYH